MNHDTKALSEASAPSVVVQTLPWEQKFKHIGFQRFCLLAAAIAFFGSTTLMGLFTLANQMLGIVPATPALHEQPGGMMIFGNLVLAPLVETALMVLLLKLFVRAGLSQLASIVLSALIWAFLHGTLAPLRFGGTIWSFFVFGYCYFFWSNRQSNKGFFAASITHSFVNVLPTISIFAVYYTSLGKT